MGIHTANKAGLYSNDRDSLKGMLLVNSLRGAHSTGLMGFHKDEAKKEQVNIIKAVGSPYALFDWHHTNEFFSRMVLNLGTVVGHGRFATKGEINADNAHPFEEGHITLVHNGMISNYHMLKNFDNAEHKRIEVDSHLVARLFAEEGAEAVLPRLKGAYTLVWYDSKTGKLNMARNNERPMFLANSKDNHDVLFASEEETLQWASARYDLELHSYRALPAFTHITFERGSIEPEVREYKEKFIIPATVKQETPFRQTKETTKAEKKKARQRATPITNIDKAMAETSQESDISLGEEIDFTLEDIKEYPNSQNKIVVGYNDDVPNVEFAFHSQTHTDDQLIEAIKFKGVIERIVMVAPSVTARNVRWRAFLDPATVDFIFKSETSFGFTDDNQDWVRLQNISGVDEDSFIGISSHRIRGLGTKGCGWCQTKIDEKEYSKPQELGFWEFDGEESIICCGCANGYRQKRGVN